VRFSRLIQPAASVVLVVVMGGVALATPPHNTAAPPTGTAVSSNSAAVTAQGPTSNPAATRTSPSVTPAPPVKTSAAPIAPLPQPVLPSAAPAKPVLALCYPKVTILPSPPPFAYVCGSGFHPRESIALNATGQKIEFTWHVMTDGSGKFAFAVPGNICQYLPVLIVASEKDGTRSNPLMISGACIL